MLILLTMEKPTWRIRIFSDFCTSEIAASSYEICCKAENLDFYGEKKDFVFTNGDDYTHAILLNKAMPVLNIPKERVIGLAQEPFRFLNPTSDFIDYAVKYIGRYYIGDTHVSLPEPFVEGNAYIFYDRPYDIVPAKPNLISIMVSQKTETRGHIYRHKLVERILESNLPIDIWGRGCEFYENTGDKRIRGDFKKYEPYESYQFHIAIENFKSNYYFSEKIITPILLGTTPIYIGCYNIGEFFPNQTIRLTGNLDIDINTLTIICMEPESYRKDIDLEGCENRVNILRNMKTLFPGSQQAK